MKYFGKFFTNSKLQFAEAMATLMGSIVGVGILGLPYAISKVGFFPGIAMLFVLGICNCFLLLMFAEITLRTKGEHEIPGYGGAYLGFRAQMLALLAGVVGSYGTLLAYLIAQGQVLSTLFGGPSVMWSLAFFSFVGVIIYRGVEAVRIIELIMVTAVWLIFFSIGLTAQPHINDAHLAFVDVNNFITPYGVLLFALSGTTVVPQIREQLKGAEKAFPWVIVSASVVVLIMYAALTWLVLGVTGAETTEIATIGLGEKIGPSMLYLGNALAFFTITTSCITMGLSLRRVFQYDYGFSRLSSWLCTMMIPLGMFLLGFRNFISVLTIVGGTILSVQNAIVIFAFWRARIRPGRKPEFSIGSMKFIGYMLLIVFILGAALTLYDAL